MAATLFPTAFGTCGIAWGEMGLTGFQLPDDDEGKTRTRLAGKDGSTGAAWVATETAPPWIESLIGRAQQHFLGCLQDFSDAAIDWARVSPFQKAVYLQAQAIKPGYKTSYGEIAVSLGIGLAGSRAVGIALATNPWPLLVPCHRVVSAADKMTGFSAPGGIRTKTRLLALEGAELLSE